MEAREKIEKILNTKNINYSTLSELIGVDKSTFTRINRGDTKAISSSLARKINKLYPDIPVDWLRDTEDYLNMNYEDLPNFRKQLGLGQSEFAKSLGVHNNTIQNWEKKKGKIEMKHIALIKNVYPDIGFVYKSPNTIVRHDPKEDATLTTPKEANHEIKIDNLAKEVHQNIDYLRKHKLFQLHMELEAMRILSDQKRVQALKDGKLEWDW